MQIPIKCPVGTSTQSGESNGSNCLSCNPCPSNTWEICKPGTYVKYDNGIKHCLLCPLGNYCPDGDTITPKKCPVGTYAGTGHSLCKDCGPGYYNPK